MSANGFKISVLLLAMAPTSGSAEVSQSPAFDIHGYLEACSTRIPDVAMQVPMLQLCVSTATKLCNLSLGEQGLGGCLTDVTVWLEQDSLRIEQAYPGALDTVKASSAASDLLPRAAMQTDCSDTQTSSQDIGLTPKEICGYQTALSTWFKLRVVELNQSNHTR
ncbi:hypothetical protein [Roseobacter sp. SK209-2-6]|uniref:hypothetical protein n=1 Tax=Roseobacter sp. SK209-2-6 TaxID=388739 RepID=UPI00056B88CD|nr:hypothetical protein [Roseobacter sp. SK209-2-6]